MEHRALTLAAAIVAAGLIGFDSPLAATAMDHGMHASHHDTDFRRHHHHDYMASCYYRHGYYRGYGYRHHCRPMGYRHMGYGYRGYGYMRY